MVSGAEEAGGVVSTHWHLGAAAREWPLRMRAWGKGYARMQVGQLVAARCWESHVVRAP